MENHGVLLRDFCEFLLSRVYKSDKASHFLKEDFILKSFQNTVEDVKYHFPMITETEIMNRILANSNELAIFLYRWGRAIWEMDLNAPTLSNIHWLMKELCSCEIYFSSQIGIGFYIFHGSGTVIGSRNTIGKGMRIYQNVTVGHKFKNSVGVQIGNDVRLYAGAKVLGEISIVDNVIVGSNTVITKNVEVSGLIYGNPNKFYPYNSDLYNKLI